MKKTNNIGKVLLVTLLIDAIVSAGIELSIWYFEVEETMVTLDIVGGIIGSIAFAMILFGRENTTSHWVENSRERMWYQQRLTEEAFRQKYCK